MARKTTRPRPTARTKRSEYPGHLVVWNDEATAGNWIDFYEENSNNNVVVEEQNKNYYSVYVYPEIPKDEFWWKNANKEPDWNDEKDVLKAYNLGVICLFFL